MTVEPPWMDIARRNMGLHEGPGASNNPVILGWIRKLGARVLGIAPDNDAVPWCGTFVAMCMAQALPDEPLPHIAIRALAWADFGTRLIDPALGCVMVFQRPGGGHVAFYVGEDDTAYHVLGGNQSDAVTITRIEKARCVAIRWPTSYPQMPGRVHLAVNGAALSRNEA